MSGFRTGRLGYVELNVSDLERSIAFYRDIVGLQFVEMGSQGEARFRCTDDFFSVVLHKGEPGFARCGWSLADEAQFELLHERLDQNSVAWELIPDDECASRLISRGTRLTIPSLGAIWEFYLPTPELESAQFVPTNTQFARLGHVVFRTVNYDEVVSFFLDVLNFRVSDDVGDQVILMRPWGSPFHHGVGLARSEENVFHHLNFMVTDIDDIGKAIHRLQASGTKIVYGPGRHPASGSIFLYFLDPDQTTLEFSFGMEEFADEDYRIHRVLPLRPESSDSWGAPRDPLMSQFGSIQRYSVRGGVAEAAPR